MEQEEVATAGGHRPRPGRPWAGALPAAAILAVIAMGATGLTVVLTRSSGRTARPSVAARCAAPSDGQPTSAPLQLGSWPFHLLEPGTFGSVLGDGPGDVVALQACGPQETMLRTVRIGFGVSSARITAAGPLERAALLTSSIAVASGVFVGLARLDLAGTREPPYELTVQRLDPVTLEVQWASSLGRGYGLSLATLRSGAVVASTGHQLLLVSPRGAGASVRLLRTFSGVVQHVAVSRSGDAVAVSLIQPGAVGASAAPELESIDLASGATLSNLALASGSDPESLALSGPTLWAAIGNGQETAVLRYGFPGLAPRAAPAGGHGGVPTTLQSVGLDATSNDVWVRGLTLLGCASPATGRLLASTAPVGSPPPYVSEILGGSGGRATLAVSQAGIGRLSAPSACTP